MQHEQAVSRLAGQLDYMFEDQPEWRGTSPSRLLDRLNYEDRLSRARAEEPLESDAWVTRRAEELDNRFSLGQIEEALEIVRRRGAP